MIIGGLQKMTLIDYPGKVAATIFVSGCNFFCPWCYNRNLVVPEEILKHSPIPLKEIYKFLEQRKGFLQGVVLCGGEPTIYDDLSDFAAAIKKMGYLVKLDTNGSNPEMLTSLIDKGLVDYVAMDIKAPKESYKERYKEVVGKYIDTKKIEQSINILKNSPVEYEFRTTLVPGLVGKKDILEIVKWIGPAKKYFLQNFQPKDGLVNPLFSKKKPYSDRYLKEIQKEIASNFKVCQIR